MICEDRDKFRPWLIEKAKGRNLIYKDQMFIPGKNGEYPEDLEIYKTTKTGLRILIRPAKISDEPQLAGVFEIKFFLDHKRNQTSGNHENENTNKFTQ